MAKAQSPRSADHSTTGEESAMEAAVMLQDQIVWFDPMDDLQPCLPQPLPVEGAGSASKPTTCLSNAFEHECLSHKSGEPHKVTSKATVFENCIDDAQASVIHVGETKKERLYEQPDTGNPKQKILMNNFIAEADTVSNTSRQDVLSTEHIDIGGNGEDVEPRHASVAESIQVLHDIVNYCNNTEHIQCAIENIAQQEHLDLSINLEHCQIQVPQDNVADQCEQLSFNDLPDEVQVHIFSYLSQKELCLVCALVCSHWKQLAYDSSLWQKLTLGYNLSISSQAFQNCLQRAHQVRTLNICWRSGFTIYEATCITTNCSFINELDMGFCDDVNATILQELADGLSHLRKLNIEGCPLVDKTCVKPLSCMRSLRHLNVSHCNMLGDDELMTLSASLQSLSYLNIDGLSQTSDRSFIAIIDKHCSTLETFIVDGAELSDTAIKELPRCTSLKDFSISFAELLTDTALIPLQYMGWLHRLTLRKGAEISSSAFRVLFEHASLSNVVYLDLSECTKLRDNAVKAMVACCGANLKELNLRWCWNVTDKGLEAIISNCRNMIRLEILGLDKLVGKCLFDIPFKMPKLKHLDLQQCNRINDDVVTSLVSVMPELYAINYYGEDFRSITRP